MEFRAPTHPAWAGKKGGWQLGPVPDSSPYSFSIAPCLGQFADDPSYHLPAVCMSAVSVEATPLWDVGLNEGRCTLEPGKTYYLNTISAVLPDLTTTACKRDDYCSTPVDFGGTVGWPSQAP